MSKYFLVAVSEITLSMVSHKWAEDIFSLAAIPYEAPSMSTLTLIREWASLASGGRNVILGLLIALPV